LEITLEYLKYEDLEAYKTMRDDILGESMPLSHYQVNFDDDHRTVKIIVAKKGEEIIGTITFALIDTFTGPLDPKIEFSNFATTLAARGTDTAKLLMNYVTDYALANGYKSVVVNCMASAERAHGFYEKMGFEKLGDSVRFMKKTEEPRST